MRAFRTFLTIAIAVLVTYAGNSLAPAQNEVMQEYNKAIKLMEGADWAAAAEVFQGTVDRHGENAMQAFGPAFGLIYYHLGLCQNQHKDYPAAAKSFETTYKKFPNAPGAKTNNHYHNLALYQWARCEQATGHFDGAIKLYKKFIEGASPKEKEATQKAIREAEAAAAEAESKGCE